MSANASIIINILSESRLTTILDKMPDPYFETFGSKIDSPIIFKLDTENGNREFDLGTLIFFRTHG